MIEDPTKAAKRLLLGEVVAIPTETVYGLAASLHHPLAIAQIYALKKRPTNNPLIIHGASRKQLAPYIKEYPQGAESLIEAYWPGPLTLILPALETVPLIARANLPTAAFRIPANPLAQEVLRLAGPLVMPSANLSGRPSATHHDHVLQDFKGKVATLKGGPCSGGVESVILGQHLSKWALLRHGAIPLHQLAETLGYDLEDCTHPNGAALSPGQLLRHYAPDAELICCSTFSDEDQGTILGFENKRYPDACTVLYLGPLENPEICLYRLYDMLRQIDNKGISKVLVDVSFPKTGLWNTLRERLQKAAATTVQDQDAS